MLRLLRPLCEAVFFNGSLAGVGKMISLSGGNRWLSRKKVKCLAKRPDFFELTSYEAFEQYYWYRVELQKICRQLRMDSNGTKQELNENIKAYFEGKTVSKKVSAVKIQSGAPLTLSTPLLHCGFAFNKKFRTFFSKQTGIEPFKFTADMAAAWRRVKQENDETFTLQDMLDVFNGVSDYAAYDARACQWNRFVKDFCADERNKRFKNKMQTAAVLWKIVRDSPMQKVYSYDLVVQYESLLLKNEPSPDE